MKSGSRIQYFLLSDAEPKAISFSSSLLKRYNASKGSFFLPKERRKAPCFSYGDIRRALSCVMW